jgi:hypothetical protein
VEGFQEDTSKRANELPLPTEFKDVSTRKVPDRVAKHELAT